MLDTIARTWWAFAIRGVAAILFGVLAFVWPDTTLAVLIALFGAFALIDGVTLIAALVRGDPLARQHSWAVGLMGVLGVAATAVAFLWPGLTALALLSVVAFWAIATGTIEVIAAIQLRRVIDGEFWMALAGLISIAFGVLLIAFPGSGLLTLVWLVAVWSIAFGISNLGVAYRLHELQGAIRRADSIGRAP